MLELLILVALAFPILSIAAFLLAIGARARMDALELRLAALERQGAPATDATRPAAEAVRPARPQPTMAPPQTPAHAVRPSPAPVGPPAAPPPVATPPSITFEERFGTRWVVWVGGLALALGGFFLVRYSIEQDLIGPAVRVVLGGLLAAALIAAGEWTRRTERLTGLANLPTAHIPGILTAAGTAVAYATVYAAYALYGFVDAALAFVLLGVVALATLAASLLHGPALAALGLIGAEVTPVLVSSDRPNYWALYVFLAVVTAASFALARARLWRWLAVTTIVFGVCWTFAGIGDVRVPSLGAHAFHAVAGFALSALLIVAGLLYGPPAERGRIDGVSSGALAGYVFAASVVVIGWHHDPLALAVLALLVLAAVAIAWHTDAAAPAVPAIAALAVLVMVAWAVQPVTEHLIVPGGPTAGAIAEPAPAYTGAHLVLGALFALVFGATGFAAQGRSERALVALLWAAAGALGPLAILCAMYYRVAGWERSIPFAGLALLLAALFAAATEALARRPPRPGGVAGQAIFACGAIAALALAMTFALQRGWLTVALSLMVPGIAWIAAQRPLPMLRWFAAAVAALVVARIGWEPRIVGADVGTTPIFNWLLYGYGLPALAFWTGGHLLRSRADDVPARVVDAVAVLFTVLLAVLEIRHFMNNGDVYAAQTGLAEIGMQVSVGLAMTIGLEWLRGRTRSVVHDVGALVMAALSLAGIVFGLGLAKNPIFVPVVADGLIFNVILLAYGIPAVLATVLALIARTTRPMAYRAMAAVTSVGLALYYLSLEVARFYHGPSVVGQASEAEQYTYSVVWLTFGVVLLLVGIVLGSKPARLASAAVVLLTVAKVFVIDMAGISGVWRAFSFIGLGLVLVGIGYLYQRLLFPRRAVASAPT